MVVHLAVLTLVATLAAPAHRPPATSPAEDAARLAASTTNDARFDALTGILRERGLRFEVERFSIPERVGTEPRTDGRNVVVTIGDGPGLVVVGAHYDAVRLKDGSLAKGAVDNAASSVVLVRLAESLQAEPPAGRVRVVWFDMEELGLRGSQAYVKAHAGETVDAMINFDVNGYGDTILVGPATAGNAALRRTVATTCAAESLECITFPQMPPSDDRSFTSAGVPTVSLAILPALEAHQLWLLLNGGESAGLAKGTVPAILQTIHTPADVPGKLEPAAMDTVLRFATALVRGVASR